MNIHVYKTTQEMGEEAAKLIAAKLNETIAEKGEARLCSPRALPSLK